MPDAETSASTSTPSALRSKNVVHWQEVQDTVSRIASHKGVLAISILNSDGDIVTQQVTSAGASRKSTLSSGGSSSNSSSNNVLGNPRLLTEMMKNANKYVQSLSGYGSAAVISKESDAEADESVEEKLKAKEDISFVRIRTQKDEILVAPKMGYTLVVLQDPSLSSL